MVHNPPPCHTHEGDKMFQAQRLNPRYTRPVILHGYGGAKRDIPRTLPGLAEEGWVPFAHAMVGYLDKLPPWCQDDLRPVMGTSCDFRIHPDPLTKREQLLLLSLWRRVRLCSANMACQQGGHPCFSGRTHSHRDGA